MGTNEFIKEATKIVEDYIVEHLDKSDEKPTFNVYNVWYCYVRGNIKGLFSSTLFDGMYYKMTYNKAKNEFYLDAYKKFENRCIAVGD